MPRLPRLAGVHATILVVGMLALPLVTGSASAQTPTATSTGTATGTATPVVFEVTDEGKQQLLRLLRSRFLPAPARTTLAALLEQQGVSHEGLAKLFERPRHCDDGHGSDDEHSRRCRSGLARQLPACAATATATATGTVTATATSTATGTATGTATATATRTPRGDDDDRFRGCGGREVARKAAECGATATATATGTALATATASATASATATATAKPERERCEKPEKQATGTATPTVAPAELCRQALAATGENVEKLAERCAVALKANRELAATVCAQFNTTEPVTKSAKELKKFCEKLLAAGTPKVKPTEGARVKPVGTQTSESQKRR